MKKFLIPFYLFLSFYIYSIAYVWGGGNGNWATPGAWLGGPNYPGFGGSTTDSASIGAGTVTLNISPTITTLSVSGGALDLAGNTLTTSGPGDVTMTGGTISNATGAAIPTLNIGGNLSLSNGGTLDIQAGNGVADLIVLGSITISGAGTVGNLTIRNETLDVYGNFNAQTNSFFYKSGSTVNFDGNTDTTIFNDAAPGATPALNNFDAMVVNKGAGHKVTMLSDLNVNASGAPSQTLTVIAGATLDCSTFNVTIGTGGTGTLINNGTIRLQGTQTLTFNAAATTAVAAVGTFEYYNANNTTLHFTNYFNLLISGGNRAAGGGAGSSSNIGGTLQLTGGQYNFTGTQTLTVTGTTNNAGSITSVNGLMTFSSAVTDTGIITGGSGGITVSAGGVSGAGGTFNGGSGAVSITGDVSVATFNATTATTTINNSTFSVPAGTFANDGGTFTFTNANTVSNNLSFNVVNITSGTTAFSSGASVGGTFTISGAGSLTNGATITFNGTPGSNITTNNVSMGDVQFSANKRLQDNFNCSNITLQAGTLTDNGHTINVINNWSNTGGSLTATGSVVFNTAGATSTISGGTAFNIVTFTTNGASQTINITGTNTFTSFSVTTTGGTGVGQIVSISANNTYGTFTIDSTAGLNGFAGQIVTITTGTNQNVTTLNLNGKIGFGNLIRLTSTGGNWTLTVPVSTATYVNVDHSQASNVITATTCKDSGNNNANWHFGTSNLKWIGATSNDWNDGRNWDQGYVPNVTDNVEIQSIGNQPATITGAAVTVNILTIDLNATLDINNFNLTVNGAYTNNGTFRLQGGETISANVTAAMSGASGTVDYYSAYPGNLKSNNYNNLIIENGARTVTGNSAIGGTLQLTGGSLALTGAQTLTVTGTTNNAGTISSVNGNMIYTGAVTNSGTITTTGTATQNYALLATNSGIISSTGSGLLTFTNGVTDTGTITGGAGGITVAGGVSGAGGTFNAGSGTVGITGLVSVATFNGQSSALTITGNVNNTTFNSSTNTNSISGNFQTTNFNAGNVTTSIGGGFTVPNATFTEGNSTINFTNTGAINQPDTFYNMTVSGGTRTETGNVTVTNDLTLGAGGTFQPGANTVFVGNWDNSAGGTFTSAGSTVTFNTAVTSTIKGSTIFNNFSCAQAGKQITFTAGTTQTINGTLTLTGGAGVPANKIKLRSDAASTWNIQVSSPQTVSNVDVQYSEVIGAAANNITANTSINSGNNDPLGAPQWIFTPNAIQWNGATNTDWGTVSNWNLGYVPNPTDNVTIPDVTTTNNRSPVLDINRTTHDLTIALNGTLLANGNNLTVNGTFTLTGTLNLRGDEVLVTMPPATGTVNYSGPGSYTIKNWTYNNLTVSGTGTFTIGATTTANGALTVSNGTLDATGQTVNAGTVSVSGGTFTATNATVNVTTSLALSAGTLNATGATINDAGDWNNTGGTFTNTSSTVVFNGAGPSTINNSTAFNDFSCTAAGKAINITGSNSFNNFTITTAGAAQTVTFTAGTVQTVNGTINIAGNAGNLIRLQSSISGNQWSIINSTVQSVSYVNVSDSIAGATTIQAHFSQDPAANNINWDFGGTSAPYFANLRARIGDNRIYAEFNTTVYNLTSPNPIVTNNFMYVPPARGVTTVNQVGTTQYVLTVTGGGFTGFTINDIIEGAGQNTLNSSNVPANYIRDILGHDMNFAVLYPVSCSQASEPNPAGPFNRVGIDFFTNVSLTSSLNTDNNWGVVTDFSGNSDIFYDGLVLTASMNPALTGVPKVYYITSDSIGSNNFYLPALTSGVKNSVGRFDGQNWRFDISTSDSDGNKYIFFVFSITVLGNEWFCYRGLYPANDPVNFYQTGTYIAKLRRIALQNNNVTVLNNVINPRYGDVTKLLYTIDKSGPVSIVVYDLNSDLVKVLVGGNQDKGDHVVTWDGRNNNGIIVTRGVYFIRVRAPGIFNQIRKVLIIK